ASRRRRGMRGVAYDKALRVKLMVLHEQGRSLAELSQEFAIARPVLSRWWARYRESDLRGGGVGGSALAPTQLGSGPDRSPAGLGPGHGAAHSGATRGEPVAASATSPAAE